MKLSVLRPYKVQRCVGLEDDWHESELKKENNKWKNGPHRLLDNDISLDCLHLVF